MTRLAYEPFLRGLVKMHCPSVRFVQGTVTGLNLASENSKCVESVSYRTGTDVNSKQSISAKLVVGKFDHYW